VQEVEGAVWSPEVEAAVWSPEVEVVWSEAG
jgi:hypothetical protein